MPDCPECQRLKYKVDISAAFCVETAERVLLCLDDDTLECKVAIVEMRRARSTLDECELAYEEHIAAHTYRTRLQLVS
jgi:hypothetical protein